MNIWDHELINIYKLTNQKPDKLYSILPTVLGLAKQSLCRPIDQSEIIDVGCGTGFFTLALAKLGFNRVIGLDTSLPVIKEARATCPARYQQHVSYYWQKKLSPNRRNPSATKVDLVIVPFVLNYAENVIELQAWLDTYLNWLRPGGYLIGVVDLPENKDLTIYGARKILHGSAEDGAKITNKLYQVNGQLICSLRGNYYKLETISNLVESFGKVQWHKPTISQEGLNKFGADFWRGYLLHPELGYFTVRRKL
jgi:SAM-dependent methyltransferase